MAAYRILFDAIDRQTFRRVRLSDGDTAETLHLPGAAANPEGVRLYCIAIESVDAAVIRQVEQRLSARSDAGLRPVESRFLRDPAVVKAQPLVPAGAIDAQGVLAGCDTPWIISAWKASS